MLNSTGVLQLALLGTAMYGRDLRETSRRQFCSFRPRTAKTTADSHSDISLEECMTYQYGISICSLCALAAQKSKWALLRSRNMPDWQVLSKFYKDAENESFRPADDAGSQHTAFESVLRAWKMPPKAALRRFCLLRKDFLFFSQSLQRGSGHLGIKICAIKAHLKARFATRLAQANSVVSAARLTHSTQQIAVCSPEGNLLYFSPVLGNSTEAILVWSAFSTAMCALGAALRSRDGEKLLCDALVVVNIPDGRTGTSWSSPLLGRIRELRH